MIDDEGYEIEDVKVLKETDKALLCDCGGDEVIWVPKSVVRDESEVFEEGDEGVLAIQRWWAQKQEFCE